MKKEEYKGEIAELKGIAKILDILWENSYYSMGKRASKRIEEEMIYYFGTNWSTDMYEFIEAKSVRPVLPRPLKELTQKQFNKGHQPKDEEYPPLADNSKIGL